MNKLLITIFCAAICAQIQAQELDSASYFDSEMKLEKRKIVELAMQLNEFESPNFWPLYIEFNSKLDKLDENWLFLLSEAEKQTGSLNDERANLIWREFNKYMTERQRLFNTYYSEFSKVIPSSKTFRYFMIENKTDAVVNAELVKELEVKELNSPAEH